MPYLEVTGVSDTLLYPSQNVVTSTTRRLNYRHMISEALFNLTTKEIAIMQRYSSKVINFVADQRPEYRHEARWAYHPWLQRGLIYCVDELIRDHTSRRAVVTIPMDGVGEVGTPPCLTSLQFFIREKALHCICTMRSNDVWLGLPLDIFQFTLCQHLVAAALNLELGVYRHNVGSSHLYVRDVELATAFLENPQFQPTQADFTLDQYAFYDLDRGALRRDVKQLVAKEIPSHCHPKRGFGPLVGTLAECYDYAPSVFSDLRTAGVGIW